MKSKSLLVAIAICTAFSGAAIGQATFSTSTTPDQARLGGGAELVGDIALHVESGSTSPGSIALTFTTDLIDNEADIVLSGAVVETVTPPLNRCLDLWKCTHDNEYRGWCHDV